jgi:glucose-1-phosphate thymidylyltransferase
MRGVLLAGGYGTRLRPATSAVSKQLLPVYDKPMLYYPLTTLMLAGIRDILVITTPEASASVAALLGDGSNWGLRLTHAVQPTPLGIADALRIAAPFLQGSPVALALGDNLLHGHGLVEALLGGAALREGAHIFSVPVADPSAYGVLAWDGPRLVDVVEKPRVPPSREAVPGLYFFDGRAAERACGLKPSARGELEITDLQRTYLAEGALTVRRFGRGLAWLDMGTPERLWEAAGWVRSMQARQGLLIGSPEEVAWRQGWIGPEALAAAVRRHAGTSYADALALLSEDA